MEKRRVALGPVSARLRLGVNVLNALLRTATFVVVATATGCSGDHGFLGTNYLPKGDITLTNSASGAMISSSLGTPFVDATTGFTIGIAETNFDGPYSVVITTWNNGFNKPCFVPHQIGPQGHVNQVLFSADNANPPGVTTANPCVAGDEEIVLIGDGKGHSKNLYFIY